ncbi:DUF3883 domain-containing protein [Aureispira anguillae]|uniref:DUF3883 domain-containing protein n=1 Tax=Aureispira anguillae TaxID=2864201 RepID=A0A915VKF5_9BACT|nr:DUF3883 domain-containing protein [Aureispira anguillae]BDS09575.1 DUF3883 domain-containing protein [Aureispira anguillae]
MEINHLYQTITNEELSEFMKKRRKDYLDDPLLMIENYNTEISNTSEYFGRQLLEMIQNANDECDTTKAKKVLIKLDKDSLIIANNGNPFSRGGVESLLYSNLSPKVKEENKVGQKGLGFRSVLNWSEEIYIASYNLHIRFSKTHAEDFLKGMIRDKPQIRKTISSKTNVEYPISILRCPLVEDKKNLKKLPQYDTVIELKLKEDSYQDIIDQINKEIIPEILVFLHKLEEIEVQSPEHNFILSKKIEPDKIIVTKSDRFYSQEKLESSVWFLLEEKGQIKSGNQTKNYELKIAYNPNQVPKVQKLFSYFRTEVDFPYPVLAHGTFELSANRNVLKENQDGFNKLLLDKLASLLVKCAFKITKNGGCNYAPLKLVIPSIGQHSSLNTDKWNFHQLLNNHIKEIAIFPTVTGVYIRLSDAPKFYLNNIEHLIPKDKIYEFKNLLQYIDDKGIQDYLQRYGQELRYTDSELTKKINLLIETDSLETNQRVEWIYYLCSKTSNFYSSQFPVLPNLLLNSEGIPIKTGDEIILPSDEKVYTLPQGVNFQFIQKNLYLRLKGRFDKGGTRQMVENLKLYKAIEYAANVVIQKIISNLKSTIDLKEKPIKDTISILHSTLYEIYRNQPEDYKFPSTTSPYLITREGNLKPANQLYFWKEYQGGEIMEGLMFELDFDVFVGTLNQNGLESKFKSPLEAHSYFSWLGVTHTPRKVNYIIRAPKFRNDDYLNYAIRSLKFPYIVSYNSENYTLQDLSDCNTFHANLLWYEYFDEIINSADIEYILAWLIHDRELHNSISFDTESTTSYLKFYPYKAKYSRGVQYSDIKSYIRYKLQSCEFIPVGNNKKVKPEECLMEIGNLAPLINSPIIDFNAEVFKSNKIEKNHILFILKSLGIKEDLKDLSLNNIYRYLNLHSKCFNKDRRNIQSFYMLVLEATKNYLLEDYEDSEERKIYLEEGVILVSQNGLTDYASINEATYVNNPNFSTDLLNKLKIAKLPSRAGNKRIQTLFGIQPLDYIKFHVNQVYSSNQKLNKEFVEELNDIKPFLFTYRFNKGLKKTQINDELSSLKSLKVITCYDLDVVYKLNDKEHQLELKEYEYIQDESSKVYYIKINRSYSSYYDLKKNFRFKETVSDIICGALKVSENRKDFKELLGEEASTWALILTREFLNYNELEKEIAEKFDGALTSEQRFWKIIFEVTKKEYNSQDLISFDAIYKRLEISLSKDQFLHFYRQIDYQNLSAFENIAPFQCLFKALSIDVQDFNLAGYKSLNVEDYWRNRMRSFHQDFILRYSTFLYTQGDSHSFLENRNTLKEFNRFQYENSFFFDVEEHHRQVLCNTFLDLSYDKILSTKAIDLESIFHENLTSFKAQLKKEGYFDNKLFHEKMRNNNFKDAIYFNEIIDLIEEFRLLHNQNQNESNGSNVNIGGEQISFDDTNIESLMTAIEANVKTGKIKITDYAPEKVETSATTGKKTGKQTSNSNQNKNRPEDIGFIGEKYAYELLKQKYDKVTWVSEYALKAGCSYGTDGLGYDFECVQGNETRFVEVKSSVTSSCSFYISKNEVNTGHTHERIYDILVITDLLSDNINCKYLKNIFEYENNESFLTNSKFLVENDTYRIRFK